MTRSSSSTLFALVCAAATCGVAAGQTSRPASDPSAQPGVAQPGVAEPGVAEPGVAEPGVAQPAVAKRDASASAVPASVEVVRDVVYATAATDDGTPVELKLDAAFPKQSGNARLPVVVYVHGGGYVGGSRSMGAPFILAFARGGYFAVTIDYRLAPGSRFPAAVHDCKGAIRFLRTNAEALGIDPDRIGVWGHSAGGHLSAMLGLSGNSDVLDGSVGPAGTSCAVACAVSVSGPSEFDAPTAQASGFLDAWFGEPGAIRSQRVALAGSPSHVDAADPPILLVHGENDRLVPVAHSERLHEALRRAGVVTELLRMPGQGHMINSPRAYRRIGEFFDQHLGGTAVEAMADAIKQVTRPSDAQDRRDPPPG